MVLKMSILMFVIGCISSGIGGIIASIIKIKNNDILALLFELTAGIMTGIVCFDMIYECLDLTNVFFLVMCVIIGVMLIYILDKYVDNTSNKNLNNGFSNLSLMIMLSMSFHNFIEGIALGSSFVYSYNLGIALLLSIVLHDIPEGIVVGMSYKVKKEKVGKVIFSSMISGAFTGLGALVGGLIGSINNYFVCFCLLIAAGAMLYVVSCELMPSSSKLSKSKKVNLAYIVGILIAVLIVNLV